MGAYVPAVPLPASRALAALSVLALLAANTSRAEAAPRGIELRHVQAGEDRVTATLGAQGARVALTLDPRLQREAERLLARAAAPEAAIVASDVRTGRILAWASRGDRDYVATPLAPSASLFKVVTAAALLEGGRVSPATRQCYSGGSHAIGPGDLVDQPRRDGACTTLGEALGHSVNVVFARLAVKHLSAPVLRAKALDLGFAGEVPIDVPIGSSDLRVPDDALGMARAAAGFWNGRLSPLGALFAMQTIANGGERIRLSLIDRGPAARAPAGRAVSAATARTLRQMLEVTTKRGTCARAFRGKDGSPLLASMPVAAKTGTLVGGRPSRMFSWFASFAPSDRPEIAVAVMLANDLQWRTKANAVGRDLLEYYFTQAPGRREARRSAGRPPSTAAANAKGSQPDRGAL
jgi:cell division protein FtsI/penicillin-binding protein 2